MDTPAESTEAPAAPAAEVFPTAADPAAGNGAVPLNQPAVPADPKPWLSGEEAYRIYVAAASGKSYRGESLPAGWDDLTEERQSVWNAYADVIRLHHECA
jgi:hypothetical protein